MADLVNSDMRRVGTKLESTTETRTCEILLDEYGILSIKLVMRGNSGWPDRLFVLPDGRVVWVEFKREGESPRAKQSHIHELLQAFGHKVSTYDNVEEAVAGVSGELAT
jgi:hypothetical protein